VSSIWQEIKKPRVLLVIRLVVTPLLLGVLLLKVSDGWTSSVVPPFTTETVLWLLGAFLLTFFGVVLSAMRWAAVLRALGQHPRVRRLLSHYLAGQFMANVLPSTIGGDALRVSRQSRDSGQSPTSFASVVLERMTGWLVLPVITLVGLLVNPGLRHLGRATRVAEAVAGVTLVLLVVVLVLTARPSATPLSHNEGWRRFASAVRMGVRQLVHDPAAAARVIATGFAYQLVLVVSVLMAARALGMPAGVGPTALLAFVPAVLIAQVLPITFQGLGVRESLFVLFLQPLGVAKPQAVALGLLLYLLNLLVSLLGAPAFAIGHRSDAITA
jgi:uncharacterized membrane protein YbhN (UPF0104 family)